MLEPWQLPLSFEKERFLVGSQMKGNGDDRLQLIGLRGIADDPSGHLRAEGRDRLLLGAVQAQYSV